jgi:SAM-dependent methyltransferase
MGQITTGIRSILSNPLCYIAFQNIMGAHKFRKKFVAEFIRPVSGLTLLDVGCGPADILAYLPNIDYWGFDISDIYIMQARSRFGVLGKFHCQELMEPDLDKMPTFDIVLALGLLHHLDDESAINMMRLSKKALKPGGRMLTIDPCVNIDQNIFSRFLVAHDRGKNVRDKAGYALVANSVFESPHVEVRHQNWVPYTHCIMECTRK